MHDYNLEFITKYINEDNLTNTRIYDFLYKEYKLSLTKFEKNINIFGIYFFDILKISSHINLKIREIKNNLLIEELDETNLKYFPYYNSKDISLGIKLENKNFGKQLIINNNLRKILKKILNLKNFFFNKNNIITTCESRIDNEKLIFLKSNNKKKFYVFDYYNGKNKFKIPSLRKQLFELKKTLSKLEKIFFIEKSNLKIPELVERHIYGNCTEGKEILKSKSSYLIIGSGCELKNRLVSSIFKQNNKKIIQVVHGDSYGVYDDPVWSELGDQYNADFIIGYGEGYNKNQNSNYFNINTHSKYLAGSSKTILNIIKDRLNYKISQNYKFIYFPTTFSGVSKRYGPHRDMPDQLYIDWQLQIFELFKKNIFFKIHPKEEFTKFYKNDFKLLDGDILKHFKKFNVLIFDHISTAFNFACSTNNYIIYFDLGTRKFNNYALQLIKKRALYYKIDKKLPDYQNIINDLNNKYFSKKKINEEFIANYCLANNKKRINLIKQI